MNLTEGGGMFSSLRNGNTNLKRKITHILSNPKEQTDQSVFHLVFILREYKNKHKNSQLRHCLTSYTIHHYQDIRRPTE